MKSIPFTKMSGVGNDFIIVDNRMGTLDGVNIHQFARRICKHKISLGGDELMLIEPPKSGGDFSMRTINPDGNEVKMCGNASRCIARYAYSKGIAGPTMTIDTLGGPVYACVDGEDVRVQLRMTDTPELNHNLIVNGEKVIVHTVEISGTPHAVIYMENVEKAPSHTLTCLGTAIRYHSDFPEGTNVDFVEVISSHILWQRTYERGVEGETLACGTGAVASAVISAMLGQVDTPVRVHVLGGELSVSYKRQGSQFFELMLGGGARFVAEGTLHPEAWNW